MIEKQIILKNYLVNYYAAASENPAAKTAIFLHGWRANGMIWMPVVEGLLKDSPSTGSGINIYAIDLPGFGKSELPHQPFHLKDYAEVVREFINKLKLLTHPSPLARGEGQRERSNIILVGHSFGGRVAIKLAVSHPDLIRKLVLVDCGGFRKSEWKRGLTTFFAKVMGPAFALPLLRTLRPRIYNILGADDYLAIPEFKNTFINVVNEDLLPLFPKIKPPAFVIWGENDQETPLEFGRLVHSKISNSKFYVLQNAGHFSFLDDPEEFVKILKEFIQ